LLLIEETNHPGSSSHSESAGEYNLLRTNEKKVLQDKRESKNNGNTLAPGIAPARQCRPSNYRVDEKNIRKKKNILNVTDRQKEKKTRRNSDKAKLS